MELLKYLIRHPRTVGKLFQLAKHMTRNLNTKQEVEGVLYYLVGHLNAKGQLGITEGSHLLKLMGLLGSK